MLSEIRVLRIQKCTNFGIVLDKVTTKNTNEWYNVKLLSIPDKSLIFIRSFCYYEDAKKLFETLSEGAV